MLTKAAGSETVACDLCGARNDLPLFFKDREEGQYRIAKCASCGLVYVNPRRFAAEHDGYFSGPYLDTIEVQKRLRPTIEQLYSEILRGLEAYLYPGRLLDVGCAMGHFMDFARGRGWEVTGVECSRYAAHWGRDRFRLRVHPVCDLSRCRYPADYCDAAVLVEVVEHLPSPRKTLTEVLRVLKPGGVICLTTPNFDSYRSQLLQEEWDVIIPSGHLYYFNAQSLRALLASVGFTDIVELTKPGNFLQDVEYARTTGKLKLGPAEIEELRTRLAREDAGKLMNARSEGLVLCAQKPLTPGLRATRKLDRSLSALDGKLVQASTVAFGTGDPRIFYIHEGVKHWVTSEEWIAANDLRFPEDLMRICPRELSAIPEGPALESSVAPAQ
jgi:SAM-dependent methyltransferase